MITKVNPNTKLEGTNPNKVTNNPLSNIYKIYTKNHSKKIKEMEKEINNAQ